MRTKKVYFGEKEFSYDVFIEMMKILPVDKQRQLLMEIESIMAHYTIPAEGTGGTVPINLKLISYIKVEGRHLKIHFIDNSSALQLSNYSLKKLLSAIRSRKCMDDTYINLKSAVLFETLFVGYNPRRFSFSELKKIIGAIGFDYKYKVMNRIFVWIKRRRSVC